MNIKTETETVIKKILPYLERRGYDIAIDLDFETPASRLGSFSSGYVDILVTLGREKPAFLIEAKKISKKLTTADRDQAVSYAESRDINVPFVVVTNGVEIQCFNTRNKKPILWDGKLVDKIPTKEQLKVVIRTLKANPDEVIIPISHDKSLPFRPGLPLRQLNSLFYKSHSTIRKIEKSEENAFADFSKLLFLKLLEEKSDVEPNFILPYSYRFHELAEKPISEADQVMDSVLSMVQSIVQRTPYGEVLEEKIKLKNPRTFHKIIKDLSSVSFYDCSLDSKGAAFEYFVRATLKGKKLGQYFTPRELIQVMLMMVGEKKIVNSILSGRKIKILDPACGTGGFLVYLMQASLRQLNEKFENREITKSAYNDAVKKIKEETFFGSDANEGVAASAKMNMIIAGDGHTNIQHEDSLSLLSKNWSTINPDCDLILTNPPFGTSESDSLTEKDVVQFDVASSKGQYLFLQKMIKTTVGGGEICTVIDEGVLNTESGKELRKFILKTCRLIAVVSLPEETFKPNKINVKSSLLFLEKKENIDEDLDENYNVSVCQLSSLGYAGSGEKIRGFDSARFFEEISTRLLKEDGKGYRSGYNWKAFSLDVKSIVNDPDCRFDYKYWDISTRREILKLSKSKSLSIKDLNLIKTSRGKSPSSDSYVDQEEGYALVVKAGSSISKFGNLIIENSDWIEKSTYEDFVELSKKTSTNVNLIFKGDVLLSSTGEGTLGKCCVFDLDIPAVADGHVTIIRPKTKIIAPSYLADYLRNGFGSAQVQRLYTGSTGLIELTPDQVDSILIDLKGGTKEQIAVSKKLRQIENEYKEKIKEANILLGQSKVILTL